MTYRLVKITNHYPHYLADFRQRHPPDPRGSYPDLAAALHADGFGWADFYARNLRALGVDAHELVGNADWLQHAWATEHGSTARGGDLVLEQLRQLKPDVLFVQDIFGFDAAFIRAARATIPSLRLVLGWCCAPYTDANVPAFATCDALLTCTPGFVADFAAAGQRAFQLKHAFEATMLDGLDAAGVARADVTFMGTLIKGTLWHDGRGRLLEHLIDSGCKVQLFGKLVEEGPVRARLKRAAWLAARCLDRAGLGGVTEYVGPMARVARLSQPPKVDRFSPRLRAAVRPAVFGRPMYQALRGARVGLNVHGDITPRFAGNMRLFECTGVGTCLLTDWKQNLAELFEPDAEVVSFSSVEECAEKAAWLLANDAARQDIAVRGQRRTLTSHTFALRARELNDLVRRLLRKVA